MCRFDVMLAFHVLLKGQPRIAHVYFSAPGADTNEFFQIAQTPQYHDGRDKDCGAQEKDADGFKPVFLRARGRFDGTKVKKRDVKIFVEPDDREHRQKSDQLDEENHFLVSVVFHSILRKSIHV